MPIGIDLSTMPMGGFTFPRPKDKTDDEETKAEVPFTPKPKSSTP
jgi:hypothetical protein